MCYWHESESVYSVLGEQGSNMAMQWKNRSAIVLGSTLVAEGYFFRLFDNGTELNVNYQRRRTEPP